MTVAADPAARTLDQSRMDWNGWPLERMVVGYIGFAYVLLGLQLWFSHSKAGYHNALMRVPLVVTPLLVLGAGSYVLTRGSAALSIAIFALGLVVGIVGSVMHTRGVIKRPGGFTLRNMMEGPPFLLSSAYWTLSAFALLVHFWPRIAG